MMGENYLRYEGCAKTTLVDQVSMNMCLSAHVCLGYVPNISLDYSLGKYRSRGEDSDKHSTPKDITMRRGI